VAEQLAHRLFDDKIDRYFHQNILDYTYAAIYEIVIEERDLAMELFYSLQEGDLSYAAVANQYLPDIEQRRRGGYVGMVSRKQLRPEVSAAVFAGKPPQLIKPVTTAVGVHLIYVEDIVQPELNDRLRSQILVDMFESWIQQEVVALAANTPIEI
jgi:parvulin-like peptidyl-prolyl isomerase